MFSHGPRDLPYICNKTYTTLCSVGDGYAQLFMDNLLLFIDHPKILLCLNPLKQSEIFYKD